MDAKLVSIHRGDESGQVIATTKSFQGKDGITEIQLTQVEATVPIRHKHHTLPFLGGYTAFRADGKQYEWKKHQQLIDQSSGKRLATFGRNTDKKSERLGRLTIMRDGQEMIDLIVITCLVDQERGDEGKWTVTDLVRCVLTLIRDRRRPFKAEKIMVKLEFKTKNQILLFGVSKRIRYGMRKVRRNLQGNVIYISGGKGTQIKFAHSTRFQTMW